MAKNQKLKEVEQDVPSTPEQINEVNSESVVVSEEAASIEQPVSDELSFLNHLLSVQVSGSWHGPAAELIKQRIAQIKGK